VIGGSALPAVANSSIPKVGDDKTAREPVRSVLIASYVQQCERNLNGRVNRGRTDAGGTMTSTHFGFETVDERDKARRVRGVFDSVAPLRRDERPDVGRAAPRLEGLHRDGGQCARGPGAGHCRRHGRFVAGVCAQGGPHRPVVHTDINEAMLRTGRDRLLDAGLVLPTLVCDAEKLPFADGHFDVVSVAFGLRNMTHKDLALAEMCRVLKPGGKLAGAGVFQGGQAAGEGLRLVFLQGAAQAWASWWPMTTPATATWRSPSACTRARRNSKP
jgi:SAM-dependent methyltransferase